jgi:galactose-1-phosphate uridylyltransferase
MSIEHDREFQHATLHSPLEDFERVDVEVEVREDPLTDAQSRIVPESFLTPEEDPDIESVVTDDEGCFFCPEMVGEATPTYTGPVDYDRGERGTATSFPNLNPYGAHSNVVVLTDDHFRPLDELGADTLRDGLALAVDYVGAVFDASDAASHASVNMNFLRPAGSSIIHPHMQTLVDDRGTNRQRRLVAAARDYHDLEGSDFWSALLAAESGGDRYIGSTGSVEWLAPFAPAHHYHVRGVVTDESAVLDPDGPVIADLAAGLDNVLAAYAGEGLNSFNFALSIVPGEDAMVPAIDVVARSVFGEYYWSDSPFFTVLHDEATVDVAPEAYAATVADAF